MNQYDYKKTNDEIERCLEMQNKELTILIPDHLFYLMENFYVSENNDTALKKSRLFMTGLFNGIERRFSKINKLIKNIQAFEKKRKIINDRNQTLKKLKGLFEKLKKQKIEDSKTNYSW